MTVLTALQISGRHRLTDAVRSISWSPNGRWMALGADGCATFDGGHRLTAPIGPDPIASVWVSADRVAVTDGHLGVILAGGGSTEVIPAHGAVCVAAPSWVTTDTIPRERYFVIAGTNGLTVAPVRPHQSSEPAVIPTGSIRTATHLGGSVWLAGGSTGLFIVDVALECVDQSVALPGVVSLAAAASADRAAIADSTGSLHVIDLEDPTHGAELTGYPDAVRHLGMGPSGDVVVACADDELTWWAIGQTGEVAAEPECGVGHDAPITALGVGIGGFVATGDADGLVRLWSSQVRDIPLDALRLDGEITVLSWSPWGDRLAIGTCSGDVVVASVDAGELL